MPMSEKRTQHMIQYARDNTKCLNLRFVNNTERDLIEWVFSKENKCGYIKDLIRADMMKHKAIEDGEELLIMPNGDVFPRDVIVNLMDDEIREEVHAETLGDCTEQEFLNEYCKKHLAKFGEEFIIN